MTTDDRRERRLSLELTDLEQDGQLSVVLDVTNIGGVPVKWDREFAVFLSWRLNLTGSFKLLPTSVTTVENREREPSRRFVTLKPRERIKRKIVLSEPFRSFHYGEALTDQGGSIYATDNFDTFDVPPGYRVQSVSVEYDSISIFAPDSFRNYFGAEPGEAGFAAQVIKTTVLQSASSDRKPAE